MDALKDLLACIVLVMIIITPVMTLASAWLAYSDCAERLDRIANALEGKECGCSKEKTELAVKGERS